MSDNSPRFLASWNIGIVPAVCGLLSPVCAKDHDAGRPQNGVGYGEQKEDAAIETRSHAFAFRRVLERRDAHGTLRVCRHIEDGGHHQRCQRQCNDPAAIHDQCSFTSPVGITKFGDWL